MAAKRNKTTRYILGALLLLVALNAVGGGYYGMAGAKDVPVEWLRNSPFKTYFIPALILFAIIGGACSVSAVAVFKNLHWAWKAATGCSILLWGWLAAQVAIIGYVSPLQPATAIAAALILLLSLRSRKQQFAPNK